MRTTRIAGIAATSLALLAIPAIAGETPTKGPGDTPASTSPPGQPGNSETSDRTPEKATSTGSEKDRTTPADPATKTPRAPDEMKK